MWKKLISALTEIHIKVIQKAREIKADERGLSGVVVAVLLILVAVLAVVVIWGLLSGYLEDMWQLIVDSSPS